MIWNPATHDPANGVGDADGGDQGGDGALADPLLGGITYQTQITSCQYRKIIYIN